MPQSQVSFILPVRDREREIRGRLQQLSEMLNELHMDRVEILVVDDGSRDSTPIQVAGHAKRDGRISLIRHPRPRGIEAAGQTGLERARSSLIFVQETDSAVSSSDLKQLWNISRDPTIVMARAESKPQRTVEQISPALVRRLRTCGTDADLQLHIQHAIGRPTALQLIRRPQIQELSAPKGDRIRLECETKRIHTRRSLSGVPS